MDDSVKRQLHIGVGMNVSDSNQGLENILQNITEFNNGSKKLAESMADIEKSVQKVLEKQGLFSKQTQSANQSVSSFAKNIKNEYDANVTSAVTALKRLEDEYEKLQKQYSSAKSSGNDTSKIVAEMKNIVSAKNQIKKQEQKIQEEVQKHTEQSEKKITSTTISEHNKQKSSAKEKSAFYKQMANDVYKNAADNLRKETAQYKQALQERVSSSKAVEQAFSNTKSGLNNQLFNTAVQITGVRQLVNEVENLGRAIIDINYNTINNQRLMGDFSKTLRDQLNNSAAETAKNTGILITDAQEIQGAWIRINEQYAKSPELLAKISDTTAKFMSVGEIENAEDAVKLLNSTLLQFNLTGQDVAKNAELIANKFAYMADVTAMGTADEYAESIAQIGANIKNMKGDVDDAIALTSIVGDKLAKNGKEAGAAIKTFSTYMQRDQTLDLMDELADKWNDNSVRIRQGTEGLKDFKGTLNSIAVAYSRLKAEGDDQGVLSLVNALGATRRRDAAYAMLDAISSSEGQNLDYYYEKIDEAVGKGNYLEQQNEVLMTSLKKQYASFVASLQQAGMALGNSGILTGVNIFMGGLSKVLDLVNKIPQPVMSLITGFVTLKTAIAGLNKIGEITGLTEKLWQSLNSGTKSQIEAANATRQATDSYLNQQKVIFTTASSQDKLTESYNRQLAELTAYESAVAKQNDLFVNGSIDADTYRSNLDNLTGAYQRNISAIAQETAGLAGEQGAIKRTEQALQQETRAENSNTAAKKSKLATLVKQKATRTAENTLQKTGILLTEKETIADKASAIAKSLVGKFTKTNTVAHGASTVAKTAETVATKVLTGAMTGLGVAISGVKAVVSAFLSPMGLITAAIGLFTFASSKADEESQKLDDSINDLSESVSKARERVQELKDQQTRSGLSGTEEKELSYLQSKIALEEKALQLKKQQQNTDDYFGGSNGFLGIGKKEDQSDIIEDTVSAFKDAQKQVEIYSSRLDNAKNKASELRKKLDNVGTLDDAGIQKLNNDLNQSLRYQEELTNNINSSNEDMLTTASDVVSQYNALKELLDNDQFTGKGKKEAEELLASLDKIYPTAEKLVATAGQGEDAIGGVANAAQMLADNGLDEFNKSVNEAIVGINNMQSDIEKLTSGTATTEDLTRMAQEYDGFANKIGESTVSQIEYIQSLKNEAKQNVIETIDSTINDYNKIKSDLESKLTSFEKQKISVNSEEVVKAKQELEQCNEKLSILQAQRDIQLDISTNNNIDLTGIVSQLDSAVSSTQDLINAQAKLAEGTALSKSELLSLAQAYPELLSQANLFTDGSVEAQKTAISAILGMEQEKLNVSIDAKIQELKADKEKLKSQLTAEQKKEDLLNQLRFDSAENYIGTQTDLLEFLEKYNNAEGKSFTEKEKQKAEKSKKSADAQSNNAFKAGKNIADSVNDAARVYAESLASAASSGSTSLSGGVNNIISALQSALPGIASFASSLANAMAGKPEGVSGGLAGGMATAFTHATSSTYHKAGYQGGKLTVDGKDVGTWKNQQIEKVEGEISKIQSQIGKIDIAIGNLEAFKKLDLKDFNTNNGSSSGSGNKGSSAADKAAKQAAKDAEKAAKEAEKAAKEAAKAAEEERKAIESITESYISNVEELQSRIAKALKKKYEEQYNERKKLLEKEHNERVKQIQDEIDRLQGNTPQNKKDELSKLKDKFEQWTKDDSSLGKAKQKEYLDQIKELEKEIKIDALEEQLEKENKSFDDLIDTENVNCDKILQTLTKKMDDEHLYKEANDLIRNGKIQEITDLLTKYDAQWDGWATLMGKSAGEIIAEQVKLAIANFVDVVKGSITPNGGVYTNQITGGSTSTTSSSSSSNKGSSSSSSNKKPATTSKPKNKATVTVTAGMTLWDLAQKYYGNPYKWTKIQKANGNVNPRKLRIGSKLVIPFKSGGYTGDDEGIALLHKKERVLNSSQTKAFDKFVYDMLPRITKRFSSVNSNVSNNKSIQFNKPFVQVNVDKVEHNTKFDERNSQDNLDRLINNTLKKNGFTKKL